MRPTRNLKKLLKELKRLGLPKDEFVVISGGVLALRGIRECQDLDLIFSPDSLEKLSEKYKIEDVGMDKKVHLIDRIEALITFGERENVREVIETADVFDGVRFENLERTINRKRRWGREKDLKDIELIKEYLWKGGR